MNHKTDSLALKDIALDALTPFEAKRALRKYFRPITAGRLLVLIVPRATLAKAGVFPAQFLHETGMCRMIYKGDGFCVCVGWGDMMKTRDDIATYIHSLRRGGVAA